LRLALSVLVEAVPLAEVAAGGLSPGGGGEALLEALHLLLGANPHMELGAYSELSRWCPHL
jgi:hypothetical protein